MASSMDRLHVEITTKGCQFPEDERGRLQTLLKDLGETVKGFVNPALAVQIVFHPNSDRHNVEFKLKLPGRTLFTGDEDPYLDTALSRYVTKMMREVAAYQQHPDHEAMQAAERRAALDRRIVDPQDFDAGPLVEAAKAGDYRIFRTLLARYEEWLRKRVGRLVQRHPEAQARVGKELLLGDVVEQVYLRAFEGFTGRPSDVRLSEWLEGLIDPSIRALVHDPEEEAAAASFARTVREGPLEAAMSTSAARSKGGA